MTSAVRARNLTKRFAGFSLVDVSLDIPEGCVTAVFGPTGAGKTTLTKLIANVIRPDSGEVEVLGMSYATNEREIKNRVGFVSDESLLYPDKSVRWIAEFVHRLYSRWDGSRFEELLSEFGVDPARKIRQLSRGQKALTSIAIALSHGADLLLLDEPTAALDLVVRKDVAGLLRDFISDEKKTMLMASHSTDGVDDMADYVVFLSRGKVILQDERDELLSRWKWVHFREGSLPDRLADALHMVDDRGLGMAGLTDDFASMEEALSGAVASGDVKLQNARIDDIFIALVKGD